MIKVRAGQIWLSHAGERHEIIKPIALSLRVHVQRCYDLCNFAVHIDSLRDDFTFVPQNDLEFAAINLDKWYFAADHIHIKNGALFICDESMDRAISRSEWQAMRYHLGLDTKPHYRFINGQWSKTS